MCNVQCATDNVQCAVLGGRSVRTTLPLLPACLTAQCTLKLRLTQLWANLMSHVPVMCLMYMQRKVPSYPPAPFSVLMQIIFMQVCGFANSVNNLALHTALVAGHSLEGTTVILLYSIPALPHNLWLCLANLQVLGSICMSTSWQELLLQCTFLPAKPPCKLRSWL